MVESVTPTITIGTVKRLIVGSSHFQREFCQQHRTEFVEQNQRIGGDTPAHFEQRRTHVRVQKDVVKAIPAPQVEQQDDHHGAVAEQPGEHRRARGDVQVFKLEDVDQRRQRERAAGKRDRRQVEADPDAPGKGFAQVGGRAQPGVHTVDADAQPEARVIAART